MFTWLNPRPASFRRAARPAAAKVNDVATAVAVLEVPPSPAKPGDEGPSSPLSLFDTLESRLEALPPFPETGSADRAAQLLDILRTLDRIAGDVVAALDAEADDATDARLPRKPR